MNRYRIKDENTNTTFVMTAMSLSDLKHKLSKSTTGIVNYEISRYTVRESKRIPKVHKLVIFGEKEAYHG